MAAEHAENCLLTLREGCLRNNLEAWGITSCNFQSNGMPWNRGR
jgi:hypothetical protein